MGKKLQGAKLRAKKRSKLLVNELQEAQADEVAAIGVTNAPDEDVFMVDTTGETVPHSKRPARGVVSGKTKKKKICLSDKDQQQVDAILRKHGPNGAKEIAATGRAMLSAKGRRTTHSAKSNFDLWDEPSGKKAGNKKLTKATLHDHVGGDNDVGQDSKGIGSTLAGLAPAHVPTRAVALDRSKALDRKHAKRASAVAVDVAQQGQSYHPDPTAHKALVKKATDIEIKRNQAVAKLEAPLSAGLSAETRALLVAESDSDESSDEEEMADTPVGEIPKRSNKLTRAQRNKLKRHRELMAEQSQKKKRKKMLNQVAEIARIKKDLRTAAILPKKAKEPTPAAPVPLGKSVEFKRATQDPVHAPTVPVALTAELGTLRTLVPKGSLTQDRVSSMQDRLMTQTKSRSAEANLKRKKSNKRRKLATKGKHNAGSTGDTFEILG